MWGYLKIVQSTGNSFLPKSHNLFVKIFWQQFFLQCVLSSPLLVVPAMGGQQRWSWLLVVCFFLARALQINIIMFHAPHAQHPWAESNRNIEIQNHHLFRQKNWRKTVKWWLCHANIFCLQRKHSWSVNRFKFVTSWPTDDLFRSADFCFYVPHLPTFLWITGSANIAWTLTPLSLCPHTKTLRLSASFSSNQMEGWFFQGNGHELGTAFSHLTKATAAVHHQSSGSMGNDVNTQQKN